MNKYIEINEDNEIIDVFFDWQTTKMQSQTKILYEENTISTRQNINGKSISDEYGSPKFIYINDEAIEKTLEEIEQDERYISKHKEENIKKIQMRINKDSITDVIIKTIPQIKPKWKKFKTDIEGCTTKQEIDQVVEDLTTWLET